MLRYLKVNNLAVIDLAELELESGFICLTGESGAGKSVLIDALLLLAGKRTSSELVRSGCDKAVVEAAFDLDEASPELELLEDNQLFLRREVTAEGRSRAFVNGVMVPASVLATYAELAFEIHGQHGQQRLLKKANHLAIFQEQTGLGEQATAFAALWESFRKEFRAWWELKDGEAERLKEIDFIRLQLDEIAQVKHSPEDEDLDVRLRRARNAESIRVNRAELTQLLDRNLGPDLGRSVKLLGELIEFEPQLAAYLEQMESLRAVVTDLHGDVAYADDYSDQRELQKLEDRESDLNKLFMKYGRNLAEVLGERDRLQKRLEELSGDDTNLDARRKKVADLYKKVRSAREKLRKARDKAIGPFQEKVEANLRALAMDNARFSVLHDCPPWPEDLTEERNLDLPGSEFCFQLAANPGEPPKPLAKVASGGELSRVLLALIGAFERPTARLLVFDEIDAGLGGETAHKVGVKLAELGAAHQVLCVTHFAQVARFARQLIKLEKKVVDGRTSSSMVVCDFEQKVDELARLMGGDDASDDLREHARKMVQQQQADPS